ncbi:MAG: hypothetical protein WBO17_12570 [Sphingorhabdus sp.]
MTHEQRNAAIMEKIKGYTAKYTTSRAVANTALKREGFGPDPTPRKKTIAAA